jgi:hypothetical protein
VIVEVEMLQVQRIGGSPGLPKNVRPPDAAGPSSDARTSSTGLKYLRLIGGDGANSPTRRDRIRTLLDAWTIEGVVVEQVLTRHEVVTTAERAPAGLGAVATAMIEGERVRVWVPARLSHQILADAKGKELVVDMTLAKIE